MQKIGLVDNPPAGRQVRKVSAYLQPYFFFKCFKQFIVKISYLD